MGIPIKTNQLNVELNLKTIESKYDVFEVRITEEYFPFNSSILDPQSTYKDILSVFYISGNRFYILMKKKSGNFYRLLETLHKMQKGNKIVLQEVAAATVSQRIILSLLLNALGTYEIDFLRTSNLTGHFYCFHPNWLKKGGNMYKGDIIKIHTLEFSITEELRLTMNVRTFSSVLLKKQLGLKEEEFKNYAKYVLSANNTLRRKLKSDKGNYFILKQTKGDKKEIPFMDIEDEECFKSSKMGMMQQIMAEFNRKYSGICNVSFYNINEYITEKSPKSLVRDDLKTVKTLLSDVQIKLVDQIKSETSKLFCSRVAAILNEEYSVNVRIGSRISKDMFNICLLHKEDYYKGCDDPYRKKNDNIVVQHISLENFPATKSGVSEIVHELIIKRDIKEGKISLYNWSALNMESKISFGIRKKIDDTERFFFMEISPDGSFSFKESVFDLIHTNEYTECVNIFVDSSDVQGIVKFEDGSINIIKKTSWYTIPEIDRIHDELASGNTFLRGKEMRGELFSSLTDIKMLNIGNSACYFSGIIGEGMQTKVRTSAIIRKIEPYKDSTLYFEKLLPLMNVTFIRNGQLTVIPFPYKYLREYVNKISLVEKG